MLDIVTLSMQHSSLDQNRGAQRVKDRERERALNEKLMSMTNVINKVTKGFPKGRRRAATTSTISQARRGSSLLEPPGPLPNIYGAILSGRY